MEEDFISKGHEIEQLILRIECKRMKDEMNTTPKVICNLGWFPERPKAEPKVDSQPDCYPKRFDQLMNFYDAETMEDLIDEQEKHIVRLQAQIGSMDKPHLPSNYRNG